MGMDPKIKQIDPNPAVVKPLQGQQTNFLDGIYRGANPFQSLTSPLQQQAVGQMGQFLNQPAPEQKALTASQSNLNQQLGINPQTFGANPFQQQTTGAGPAQLQFGPAQLPDLSSLQALATNLFQQLNNPYGGQGFTNPGQDVINAAQPVFQQNLEAANTQLANTAPGRFSSAFVNQGQDLASRALQDFNLFQAQQLQAGQQLQQQQQKQNLDFLLGARQLQQGAQSDSLGIQAQLADLVQRGILGRQELFQQGQVQSQGLAQENLGRQDQFNLQARQNQQSAWATALQNQLAMMQNQQGAAGVMGQLAGQAGQNPFERMLSAAQFGNTASQNQINPLLQLMLGGLQFSQPRPMDTVVSDPALKQIGDFVGNVGQLAAGLTGGNGMPGL